MVGLNRKYLTYLHYLLFMLSLAFVLSLAPEVLAEKMVLYATETNAEAEQVMSRQNNTGTILSIPGAWDITQIRLNMNGQESFRLGKSQIIYADEPVDLSSVLGRKLAVYNRNNARMGNINYTPENGHRFL